MFDVAYLLASYQAPTNASIFSSYECSSQVEHENHKLFTVLLPLFEGHTHTRTNFSRGQCGCFAAADPSPVPPQSADSLSSIRGVPLSLPSVPAC